MEQRLRVVQLELDEAARQAFVALLEHRVAADEGAAAGVRLAGLHREAEAGLPHVVLVADVVAEVAVGLLAAQGVAGVQAAEHDVQGLPRVPRTGRGACRDRGGPYVYVWVGDGTIKKTR